MRTSNLDIRDTSTISLRSLWQNGISNLHAKSAHLKSAILKGSCAAERGLGVHALQDHFARSGIITLPKNHK